MRPAVFIDRDGTLIVERARPLGDAAQLAFIPGAMDAVGRLKAAGYVVVLVTNQSAVAMGRLTEAQVRAVHSGLADALAAAGSAIDGIYYCPHHPRGTVEGYTVACDCRKPAPGMLRRAAAELGLDLAASWMVGDMARDLDAGRAAGCRAALVRTGKGAAQEAEADFDIAGDDLAAVTTIILQKRGQAPFSRQIHA